MSTSSADTDTLLYLSEQEVLASLQDLDSVAIISEALALHAQGQVILPDEAYLPWTNAQGEFARSLNMPACLQGTFGMAGTKIINSNPSNISRNLPRASGLTLLFDAETARVLCIMEGSNISALRTASVSTLSVELLKAPTVDALAVIGAGVLARAHIELLIQRLPEIRIVHLYDLDQQRVAALQEALRPTLPAGVSVRAASSAEEAIRAAQVVVAATTTTTGYIPFAWLQPGTVLVNVSLDDPLPEIFFRADKIVVDDWHLIAIDTRRILGKLHREGLIAAPDQPLEPGSTWKNGVHGSIGEIVLGRRAGRSTPEEIILVNPFGLALEDIALATHIYRRAKAHNLGIALPR
jgi:ornithine cyclodeaminase/alanine dehydrogenase-like protein (mu-crystallin family)